LRRIEPVVLVAVVGPHLLHVANGGGTHGLKRIRRMNKRLPFSAGGLFPWLVGSQSWEVSTALRQLYLC
jgi:hypothetical protein